MGNPAQNPEEIAAPESCLYGETGSKCANAHGERCSREGDQVIRNFHGSLKDESTQDFLCRFAESARGFTPEQIVRIGDVADAGQPGALTALAAEYGRSLLDVVAVARDFGGADKETP